MAQVLYQGNTPDRDVWIIPKGDLYDVCVRNPLDPEASIVIETTHSKAYAERLADHWNAVEVV